MFRFDHSRKDFQPYGFTCELWTAVQMRRPDRHNEIELNLLRGGTMTYLLGGRPVTIQARRLVAFWAAIPHQIIGVEGRVEYYVVTLPLAWCLQSRLPARLMDRLLDGQFLCDPNEDRFELDWAQFEVWEEDLKTAGAAMPEAAPLELQARLIRLAESLPGEPSQRLRPAVIGEGAVNKAEQMAACIARHYQEPLQIKEIADRVGLHPNYAMSLFRRTFRITLNDFLTQHRVSHAQRLLVTTDRKVVDVALDSGFRSLSRFYIAFRKVCGTHPSRYRKEHRPPA